MTILTLNSSQKIRCHGSFVLGLTRPRRIDLLEQKKRLGPGSRLAEELQQAISLGLALEPARQEARARIKTPEEFPCHGTS
jgi:hypothetical protein